MFSLLGNGLSPFHEKKAGGRCRPPACRSANTLACLSALLGRHGFRDFRLYGIEVEARALLHRQAQWT
jgi:hypothetical protein